MNVWAQDRIQLYFEVVTASSNQIDSAKMQISSNLF